MKEFERTFAYMAIGLLAGFFGTQQLWINSDIASRLKALESNTSECHSHCDDCHKCCDELLKRVAALETKQGAMP